MSNCTGCNSCQNCDDGCQVCNSCERIECNTKQLLCEINCQTGIEYYSNPWDGLCFVANELITVNNLTAQKIQDAFDWITNVAAVGDLVNTGTWSGTVSNTTALAAAETVTLQSGLSLLSTSINSKSPNDIIYASYFDDIRTKMNSATISSEACDECDSKCEAKCNTCNTCESCQSCNSITYCGQYCGQYCGEYCGLTETPKTS